MFTYQTAGVCSTAISFDIKDNRLSQVSFTRGCPGNLQAIAKLVEGMELEEVITRLKGIRCGNKTTSCADQLVSALEEHIKTADQSKETA